MRLKVFAASAAASVLLLSAGIASAATALSASCSGAASATSITWTASAVGGVSPVAFLWGNGATTSVQTVASAPGTFAMTLTATDASSTVATSTCSATVAAPALPAIASFAAAPATITAGQSSVLSWTVSNASSTSINNGVGAVTGSSVTVSPSVTTTYTLSAVNPNGTTTATATVTVNATSTGSSVQDQIQALLKQIAALQAQLMQLLAARGTGTTTPPVLPPGQVGKAACVALNRDLHMGDRGDDVKKLQEMLAEDSENEFVATPTGFFGPLTAKAMMRFHMRFGIASSSTGIVGPLTRGFFERSCGKGLSDKHDETSTSTKDSKNEKGESSGHGNGNGRSSDD